MLSSLCTRAVRGAAGQFVSRGLINIPITAEMKSFAEAELSRANSPFKLHNPAFNAKEAVKQAFEHPALKDGINAYSLSAIEGEGEGAFSAEIKQWTDRLIALEQDGLNKMSDTQLQFYTRLMDKIKAHRDRIVNRHNEVKRQYREAFEDLLAPYPASATPTNPLDAIPERFRHRVAPLKAEFDKLVTAQSGKLQELLPVASKFFAARDQGTLQQLKQMDADRERILFDVEAHIRNLVLSQNNDTPEEQAKFYKDNRVMDQLFQWRLAAPDEEIHSEYHEEGALNSHEAATKFHAGDISELDHFLGPLANWQHDSHFNKIQMLGHHPLMLEDEDKEGASGH
eukprot:gnl/Hemi2/18796_TR6216_c0_g1_i1.p1 gnl/Hemi2/18796_TR6216_c0_g1~~gnl/Hemi2/18796_TR6216_c0_g1_i1.p1  ORF type:complete len:341 (-),score=162.95 gnl/Hemi2/18796_TR6216_c0_g1_i1:228-1250(-)